MGIYRVPAHFGRLSLLALMLCVFSGWAHAATAVKHHKRTARAAIRSGKLAAARPLKPGVKRSVRVAATSRRRHGRTLTARGRRHGWVQTWDEPTYANSTAGDNIEGEDLTIRRAAVDALGPYNGSVVVVNPNTGRVLTIVNQKLALGAGFQPCSTIKLTVAVAGLKENLVQQPAILRVARRNSMDLTQAIARSNNFYFATLGQKLGYDRVAHYAHEFGYGEKAGLNIAGEQPGYFPPAPPKNGGVGMLTSFGEEIQQTPLELAALVSAIANGGKLYYLQYPHTADEIKAFQPKLKRTLEIGPYIESIKPGMQGAVEARWGTARSLQANFREFPVFGKTGTCSNNGTRFGWFGSYSDTPNGRIVTVFFLEGGRPTFGPKAAELTGQFYRALYNKNYFAPKAAGATAVDGGS